MQLSRKPYTAVAEIFFGEGFPKLSRRFLLRDATRFALAGVTETRDNQVLSLARP
jgi:hypothetical protein